MRIFFRIKKNRIHARVLPSSSFQLKLVAAWSTTVLPRVGNLFDSRADRKFKVGGDERTYRIYDTAGFTRQLRNASVSISLYYEARIKIAEDRSITLCI